MCASLSALITTKKVKIVFIFDRTVSFESMYTIKAIMDSNVHETIDVDYIYSEKTASGYKRNLGIETYGPQCDLIWLLDQDDWLLIDGLDSVIEVAKETIESGQPCIMIPFQRPSNDAVTTNIDTVISMPWQYIYDPKVASKYRFDEDIEMGSDVPFVAGILTDYELYDPHSGRVSAILFDKPLYYYNYLNVNSESRRVLDKLIAEGGLENE